VEPRRRESGGTAPAAELEIIPPRIRSSDEISVAGSCLAGRYNGAADWLLNDDVDDDAASRLSGLKSTWVDRGRPLTAGTSCCTCPGAVDDTFVAPLADDNVTWNTVIGSACNEVFT